MGYVESETHRPARGIPRRTQGVVRGQQRQREGGTAGRRGRARAGLEAAELRQGAVPRQLPARPDPPAAPARPGRGREGRGVPRARCARSSIEQVDPLEIERDAKIPDAVVDGLKELGALGHEGARAVRRPRALAGLLQPRAGAGRHLARRRSSTLLSAHQSIGVAEPLLLFGSEEQKRKWLPLVASDHISAFLLTEPDVGSDPARLGDDRRRRPSGGYVLNGRKLWATNGAIADIVVVMAQVPKSDGHRGGITAFVLAYDTDGVTVEHRNAFMGLRGIENSVTLLEDVFVPEGERDRQGGPGPQDRPHHAQHRPPRAAGDLRRRRQVGDEGRARVVDRARPVGPAGRQARRRRAEDRLHRRHARSASRRCSTSPAGWPTTSSNDIRIEAAIAKLYGSELGWKVLDELIQVRGGRGYETAESLQGARREAGAGRAGAARHAHQPHLRGLDRDHAPADRARGRRPAPAGRRRASSRATATLKDKAKAARRGRRRSTRKWLPQLAVGEGQKPGAPTTSSASSPAHLRFVERSSRKLARSTFYAMSRWQAKLEQQQAFLGPDRRHRRRAVRDRRGGRLRRHDRAASTPSAATQARRAGRPVLPPGAPPRRRAVRRAVGQRRRRRLRGRAGRARRAATRGSRRASPTRRARGR